MNNFLACNSSIQNAKIVLFGAPFDGTASFRKGAASASQAMRQVSEDAIETYSPYQDKDLGDTKVHDFGDIIFNSEEPKDVVDTIEANVYKFSKSGRIPVMIGGDHLVTLGAVRAIAGRHGDLNIVHFDAHTDLRDTFHGQKLSHATVMRRAHDILGDGRIFQFGIRSGDRSEFEWADGHVSLHRFDTSGIEEAVKKIADKPVYISIDIDVLDPSELPGTGTPEAGGVSFTELLGALMSLKSCSIVGADITELSPPCDPGGASVAAACKLLRELLLVLS